MNQTKLNDTHAFEFAYGMPSIQQIAKQIGNEEIRCENIP